MDYELKVLKKDDDDKEIDFIAYKDGKKYYIQVAYSVADDKAYEREFGAFEKLDNSSKKILITNDDIDYSTSVVKHLKFKDFLLFSIKNLAVLRIKEAIVLSKFLTPASFV